ncbi:MAG: DUF2961 domain-containing protein [Planctomycetes bacterium]|nr:DUF2961 domain-containing protein [Planctomycetota bacterium]
MRHFFLAGLAWVPPALALILGPIPTCAAETPKQPRIVGAWWQVAGDPDLGDLTSPKQQPVDFAVWQAADGTWQLWSCIRSTREQGQTRLLYRWEGARLTDANWKAMGIALRADPKVGEVEGGLQAPFVFRAAGRFVMFYGGWNAICSASSTDGKVFERRLNTVGKATLFGATGNPRDPMVLRIGNLWYCYYTAHPQNQGAVYCRTSPDLRYLSEARIIARGGQAGNGPSAAECPYVVELEPGQFYLFRTQRYGREAQTSVYFSRDPLDFGVDHDEGHFLGTLPVAAPEIIQHQGRFYIAALLPSLKGIQIARLEWVSPADEPPVIPVGLDAYRQWERWPYQRIGARASMRSTYDRSGGNEGADASHFLYQQTEDFNVALDVEGPGVLYFTRYNHWHGSPWHYEVDHMDHLVRESSIADPNHPVPGFTFQPEKLFPPPLAYTWSDTQGADLSWVPIPFERSLRLAYGRTHYGTGYYIYHQYVPGARLSRPLHAWDGRTPPDADVLQLIARAGQDLVPRPDTPEGRKAGVCEESGKVSLRSGETVSLVRLTKAPAMLRALELEVPRAAAVAFSRARLRVTWDDRPQSSIDAPVALFYGTGTLYNRDGREYLVKGFPIHVRDDGRRVHLACYFPMPFFHSARIELVGPQASIPEVFWSVRYTPYHGPANQVAYFHATYADHPRPELGRDLILLDTRQVEGSKEWSGHLVGMSFIFSHEANLSTLEGDPRFFFDDSLTPQAQGTGTEEWAGGGDYWGGRTMTLPFVGHPTGAPNAQTARCAEDRIESAYRFLLADLMPFGKNARICLEHGGTNESTEHYETVTYWYGAPSASLRKTDELRIGDPASEQAHDYHSPEASAPYEITSRYEWGVDHVCGQEVYPAHTDRGRFTKGMSEFTLKLEPRNLGVLLRRKLDYRFPNQRAEVFVADASGGQEGKALDWRPAGVWYLAGSNTCVYSNPKEELGAAQHVVQTSNRRFRDDEFLVPRALTEGRSAIRVRIRFTPVKRPLFPGGPLPDLAWSEIRYDAYCFVMPERP